eukprot:172078-Chlamydomonas_euryale.AAC.3
MLLVAPLQLLEARPAHALHERAFHLADVDGRVDGVADIHGDVGAQQLEVAGQHVELHLGVEEWGGRRGVHAWKPRIGACDRGGLVSGGGACMCRMDGWTGVKLNGCEDGRVNGYDDGRAWRWPDGPIGACTWMDVTMGAPTCNDGCTDV